MAHHLHVAIKYLYFPRTEGSRRIPRKEGKQLLFKLSQLAIFVDKIVITRTGFEEAKYWRIGVTYSRKKRKTGIKAVTVGVL